MFVYYMDKTIKSWKKGKSDIKTKRLEQFRKEIQEKAKKLVGEYEKQQKQKLNKEEQEQKK